jgi:hypothetical protein
MLEESTKSYLISGKYKERKGVGKQRVFVRAKGLWVVVPTKKGRKKTCLRGRRQSRGKMGENLSRKKKLSSFLCIAGVSEGTSFSIV